MGNDGLLGFLCLFEPDSNRMTILETFISYNLSVVFLICLFILEKYRISISASFHLDPVQIRFAFHTRV